MTSDNAGEMDDSSFSAQVWQLRLRKKYKYGTERICAPEATWERVRSWLPTFGITRVADITWLDCFGIPVYAAIRPNSLTLAQSNGKGLTPIQAKVSAVMEAIEVWHGEMFSRADIIAPLSEMNRQGLLDYDPHTLSLRQEGFFSDRIPIEWISCENLTRGTKTYLPLELVSLNFCVEHRASFPCFASDSNGLASGNSHLEAALHGLCEVIERDAIMQYAARASKGSRRLVAPETIDSTLCQELLARSLQAGAKVFIEDITSEFDVPVFQTSVSLGDHHGMISGFGCHPNRETALLRSFTEVLQGRATLISGARDDIHPTMYYMPRNSLTEQHLAQQLAERKDMIAYKSVPDMENDYIEQDLQTIITALEKKLGASVLMADLSRPEYAIPVVKIAVPMLQIPTKKLTAVRTGRTASEATHLNREEEK